MTAQPDTTVRAGLRRGSSLILQGAMLLALAQAFHLESPAFYRQVLPMMLGGAVVNHFLPRQHRPAFFGVISVVSVLVVFGFEAGGWLVALGLLLIALCHLPGPFRWRIAAVVAAGAVLIAMRASWLPTGWPGVIWPILGSMFMFRLAIYLYDLKHHGPAEPGLVLSYFFLAPNVVFPFFPVVDFHTYRRTYYDRPALEIYEEGFRWIFRGFTHLIAYRVIYQHAALSPADVESTAGIVQYLVANFGLYLRVSGQFHLIVGLLHLFGFRLPETHRFFYLASSFTDLWRRINIYWKDFMQKLVYLPAFFKLKHRGETTALVGSTAIVVLVTWFLHAYQWFWLLGTWLFSPTDMVFWSVIGACLIVNTLSEQRRGRVRQLTAGAPAARRAWREAIQTAGMFGLLAFLWGFWTSPTFDDFRVLLRAATFRTVDVAVITATLLSVALVAFAARRFGLGGPLPPAADAWWKRPSVGSALLLMLIWLVGQPPPIFTQLAYSYLQPWMDRNSVGAFVDLYERERAAEERLIAWVPIVVREALRDTRLYELNRYDAERLQRGYYERIVGINRFNGQLWEIYAGADRNRDRGNIGALGIMTVRTDALQTELLPLSGNVYKGAVLRTNRWGMRDREYDKAPLPATHRIAVLGQSYVMGAGVADGETFEALIEDRLNREWSPRTGLRYESLNFAVPNYSLAQDALVVENGRVTAFDPDVLLVVGHDFDLRQLTDYAWEELQAGRLAEQPELDRVVQRANLEPVISNLEATRRLRPFQGELARWAFGRMAKAGGRMRLVYALIPQPGDRVDPEAKTRLFAAARESGFAVIDLDRVYDGYDPQRLSVSASDHHPNAQGHRVISDRLYAELQTIDGVVRKSLP